MEGKYKVAFILTSPSLLSSPSTAPLGSYTDRTLILTLPNEITVHTIDWFSVWCVPFRISFEEISIPNVIELEPEVEIPTLEPILTCPVVGFKC